MDLSDIHPSNVISFMTAITSTSGRLHCEFVRLFFLQTHRETDHFLADFVPYRNEDNRSLHFLQCVREVVRLSKLQHCTCLSRASRIGDTVRDGLEA